MTALKWFWMLSKRLYKKISFVVLLALVPICVFALVFASKEQSGFVKVVLAQSDSSDEISSELVRDFLSTESLVDFFEAETPEDALEAVKTGKADMAWVFCEDMKERFDRFVVSKDRRDAVVNVIVREANVFTRISQEKLTASLFKHCAKAQYFRQIRTKITQLDKVDDATLEKYFNDVSISHDLFQIESTTDTEPKSTDNYMTAPLRGLLAVAISICAAASAIFHMQDEKNGTFASVKESLGLPVAFACILIAAFNIATVVLITLMITGLDSGFLKEALCLAVFTISSSLFALLLKEIIVSIRVYTAIIPLLAVSMLASCPIFHGIRLVQYVFPPTYFIHTLYDENAIFSMLIYTVILGMLCVVVHQIKKIKFYFLKKEG